MRVGDRVKTIDGKVGVIAYKHTWDECNVAWAYELTIDGREDGPWFERQLTPIEEPPKDYCTYGFECRWRDEDRKCGAVGYGPRACEYRGNAYGLRLQWAWGDELYPCAKCGKLRTAAEGGTTFSVCEECWPHAFKWSEGR